MALAAGTTGEAHYPTPWAATAATSFLATLRETHADMEAEGFEIEHFADTTERVSAARQAYANSLAAGSGPALGAHLVMGPRMKEFQINVIRSEQEGAIRSFEALLRRRA